MLTTNLEPGMLKCFFQQTYERVEPYCSAVVNDDNQGEVLLIEPFYGGSHKQLIDLLEKEIEGCHKITMKDKKWHWRMRTSALYLADITPKDKHFRGLFTTSTTNLAELIALRPDLNCTNKVLYFHENQLIYPVQEQKERDFQYGYCQIVSCLVADKIIFNSFFNMESFLGSIASFTKIMPDYRPKGLVDRIKPKCQVIYFPVFKSLSDLEGEPRSGIHKTGPLHIVWAHRWEHDKNPSLLFESLMKLKEDSLVFKVSVIGQHYTDVPDVFERSKPLLENEIVDWGFQKTKEDYLNVLRQADVAISTANHEFFGVSMIESVAYGCFALCPNRLVYPELYPSDYLYNTPAQLVKKLRYFCKNPDFVRKYEVKVDLSKMTWDVLGPKYRNVILGQ